MRQIEPDPTTVSRLMMGPDGAIHVIPTETRKSSPTPREMEGQPTAAQQASESGPADLPPSYRDAARRALRDVRRAPEGGICFSYSAATPPSDRDAARRALRDIRRTPDGGICFSYSAAMPPSDGGAARRALRGVRQAPEGTSCFSY